MAETNFPHSQPHHRQYDIVILGASGFTGKFVLREALKFLNTQSSPLKTLAIAGRDPKKLAHALSWARATSTSKANETTTVPILTADTSSPESLIHVASQAKILVSCVGPFRIHGDPVVAACVETGCDYLDICGEPEFMERSEVKYHEDAAVNNALVISACGFDSVPAELGLMFNSRQWASPKEVLNNVDAYFCIESDKRLVGNFGTYESAVLGFANAEAFINWRKTCAKRPRPLIPGPPPQKGPTLEHQKGLGLWAVKLPSADAGVVRRTLSLLTKNPSGLPGTNESPDQITRREKFWSTVKPAHFGVKLANRTMLATLRHITIGILIGLFGTSEWGRSLLLKFPSLFTLGWFNRKGPNEDEVNSASFKMWFVGKGFSNRSSNVPLEKRVPDTEIITRIMGPESGYIATPIILVQCALILLSQRECFPRGGVFPPGIIFGPTDLQERLQQNGISFDFISRRSLSS